MPQKNISTLHVKKILLVIAMDSEAQPIIATLHLHKINNPFQKLPMQGYRGKYNNLNIFLVTNGVDPINNIDNVGTQAATLSTYLGINYFHPDLIINTGTAGGVKENGAHPGDIYFSKKIYFYDRRIDLKKYHEYGLGGYDSIALSSLDKNSGFKIGIVCSGDSFDKNQTDYHMFIKQHCVAVDMEAAGVAWVSMLTHTPMLAIKGITNYVRGDTYKEYQHHIANVTSTLSTKLKVLLNYLST